MALRINPGYKSLNLYFDQPTNAYDVDDVDTGGTTQVTQTDIRTDLQGLRIWVRSTSWAGADPTNSELYYDGPFQGYIAIDKLSQASTDLLADNTTYYIKYAFISKLDFFSKLDIAEHTILPLASGNPSEATGTTLDVTSPIVGYLTRDPIEIPTDSDGSNPVYTGATGTFKVYRYGQDISTNAAVTYAVSTATGGVTAAFGTGANKNVYSVTAITDLTGTIKLTATYTDPQNNANTITIEQILNVSKRRPGQTAPLVVLTATGQVFVLTEDSSGSTKNPNSIKLIATASNVTNPTYTWVLDPDGTNTPIVGTGAGYTGGYLTGTSLNTNKDELTINSSIFTGATPQFKLFSVTVGSSVIGSTISVKDRMSVYYLKEGSDSLALGLINENQTVTLDKTGTTISGLPIESEAVVVEGTTQITAPTVTFAINSQSGFGGTLTINTSVNTPVAGKPAGYIRATQITANQATATITATVAGTTLSKVLTVNRVQDGADGTNIDAQLTNDFHAIPTAADGTSGVYTGASTTIEVYKNGVLQTSGFTFYVSGLQNIKYRGTGDTSDRTGTGVTNGALTATSGTAVVNIVELSADSGYVDITAKQTTDGQLFTERFSLSRNKAGVIGKDAVIYEIKPNAKAISKQSADVGTDAVHTPSTLVFSIYKTVGNNTPALLTDQSLYYIQWNTPDIEPSNTDAYAVLVPVTGLISVVLANSLDRTSVNLKLLYKNDQNNYTQLDREEIPVLFKGAKGDSGTSVDIVFARGSSPPSLTGTGNPPNASWSTSVSTAPGTGLLWSSTGYSSDGGTTWSWDTAVQVEGVNGSNGESIAEISAFTRTTTNLSSSTISGGSYNFSNKTLTVPTGGSVTWYAAIPTGTDPLWETRTTAAVTAPTTVDSTLSWSTPVKVAQDGYTPVKNIDYFDGASAITANLTNESHSIPVDRSGAPTSYIGAETEVSVEQAGSNITSSYTWTITASSNLDTTLQAHTSNQLNSSTQLRFAFTNSNTKATLQLMGPTVTSILVRFTGTRTNYPNIVKDFTMVSVKPDVSVLELSNDVHEFSATNAGLVSVFTGGSTSYSVKRNGVDESSSWTFTAQATAGITFSYSDTSGTTQSQNTTAAVNIYAAGTTTNRTISVTNLTTAFRTGSITVTASRTGYSNLVQTFSLSSILAGYTPVKNTDYFDGNPAKVLKLTADSYIFSADASNSISGFITLTANKQNTTNQVTWSISPSVSLYNASTGGSTTTTGDIVYLRAADFSTNTKVTITASITADSLSDSTSIVRIPAGENAVNVVFNNPNHPLPTSSAGVVSSYAGSGTIIQVYQAGSARIITAVTATGTGITAGSISGLNSTAVTIADHSALTATSSATVKYDITYTKQNGSSGTISDTQTVYKNKDGASGKVVYSARVWLQTSSAPAAPTGGNFNASTGVLTAPSGWTITQPSVSTTPTYASEYTFVVDPGTTTNTGGTWSTPFIDSVRGSDGSAQERVELYLATSDGSTPAVPTSVPYTITGAVLGTVTGGTAGWSLTMPAVPANPGAVFMTTAVASSATPGTQITLGTWSTPVKVAQNGANGTSPVFIDLSNDNVSVATLANGTGGTYTSANTNVTLTSGTTDVLSSATISITPSTGVTYTYTRNGTATTGATTATNLTTGTTSLNVNITAISGQDSGTLTIVATYNSIAYTAVFTVSKAKAGSDGSPATVYEVEASGTFNINVNTNAITPASITYSAFSTTGTAARVAYSSGSIVTEYSADGSTWTTIATTNAATVTLLSSSLLATTRFVRARLYTGTNGGGTLVDQESTALSVSGTNGTNGVSPKLLTATATTNAFVYDATGGSPSPVNSTVTVTQQNITGTYYWTSTIGVTESNRTSSSSSTFTYNYTPQSLFVNMPQTITFKAYDASSGGNLLASTSVTMTASRVGTPGTGTSGASVFKAYTKTTNSSTVPAKAATTTSGAVPTSGGQTWYTDPGSIPALTGSEAQWEVDGTQPAGTTTTTWGTPYLSYFKVAQLSAIAADMGTITAGTIESISAGNGSVYITPNGMKVLDSAGNVRVRIGNLSNW